MVHCQSNSLGEVNLIYTADRCSRLVLLGEMQCVGWRDCGNDAVCFLFLFSFVELGLFFFSFVCSSFVLVTQLVLVLVLGPCSLQFLCTLRLIYFIFFLMDCHKFLVKILFCPVLCIMSTNLQNYWHFHQGQLYFVFSAVQKMLAKMLNISPDKCQHVSIAIVSPGARTIQNASLCVYRCSHVCLRHKAERLAVYLFIQSFKWVWFINSECIS